MAKKDAEKSFKRYVSRFIRTAWKKIWLIITTKDSTSNVNKRISSTSSQLTNITTISNEVNYIFKV